MGLLDKITTAQPPISETVQPQTEPQPAPPPQLPSAGIANTPDSMETAQPAINSLGISSPAVIATFGSTGPGAVDWNAITALKAEMAKQYPDASTLLQLLQKINLNDQPATLQELAKEGTPSELQLIAKKLIANPTTFQQMGPILATLVSDKATASSQPNALEQLLSEMVGNPGSDAVVGDMMQATQNHGVLKNLTQNSIDSIYQILSSNPQKATLDCLFEYSLLHETGKTASHDGNSVWGLPDPTTLAQEAISSGKDTSVADAMKLFPDWGLNTMNQILADKSINQVGQNSLDRFRSYIVTTGQDEAGMLASFCRQGSKAEPVLEAFFHSLQQNPNGAPVFHFSTNNIGFQPEGPKADEEIREMVQNLGSSAVQTLGDLSLSTLTDIKSLLLAGSDQSSDQDLINDVIDPAINTANLRQMFEDGYQASRNNLKMNF
ncbi:MAG: hypothetical protein C5B54_09595 [Acidobacteria bacterium]|nr:MAG: hypothetical protein C5B54_09595 [Acidobacteriota bacterium]